MFIAAGAAVIIAMAIAIVRLHSDIVAGCCFTIESACNCYNTCVFINSEEATGIVS